MPPPPVSGAPGNWVAEGTGVGVWDAAGWWLAVAVGVAVAVADLLAVGDCVAVADSVGVADALGVAVALWVAVALSDDDTLADEDDVADDVRPGDVLPPTDGVLTVVLVAVGELSGVGVKIDGTDEVGEPPVQAATATAISMAPAVARAAMIRRTFMKPPRTAADNGVALYIRASAIAADCERASGTETGQRSRRLAIFPTRGTVS